MIGHPADYNYVEYKTGFVYVNCEICAELE